MAMPDAVIRSVSTYDARFPLPPGAGTDSVHTNSEYSFAVTSLAGENGLRGTGIALTLGNGNKLVCEAIEMLAKPLAGVAIEELMADFGRVSRLGLQGFQVESRIRRWASRPKTSCRPSGMHW